MAQVTDITNMVNYATIVRCETGVNAKNHADIPLSVACSLAVLYAQPDAHTKIYFFFIKIN